MIQSLNQCRARLEELDRSLMDPSILSNPTRIKEVTRERAHLVPIVELWASLSRAREELEDAREMLEQEITALRRCAAIGAGAAGPSI